MVSLVSFNVPDRETHTPTHPDRLREPLGGNPPLNGANLNAETYGDFFFGPIQNWQRSIFCRHGETLVNDCVSRAPSEAKQHAVWFADCQCPVCFDRPSY